MQFTTKTTKHFEKAIRFTEHDKAFGVMVYLDCARCGMVTENPGLTFAKVGIVSKADEATGREFFYVTVKTAWGDTLYLQHPLAGMDA